MCKTIAAALLFLCIFIAEIRCDFLVKSVVSQDAPNNTEENKISYRLSEFVKPNSYYIGLKVYLDESQEKNFTFSGTVNISLSVEKATQNVILHSQDLIIKDLNIAMVSHSSLQPIEVKYNVTEANETDRYESTNFLTVTRKYSEEFEKGQYILSITFEGKLSDNLLGFFSSHYLNDEGKTVWLAGTKFEPIQARRAFPCFDEPALKATFQVKITHNNKLKAISNTRSIATTDNKDGTITTEFEKTPLMSTYLIAAVVSDFKSIQGANNFTVYVRPNAVEYGHLAVKKGQEILRKLEDFTNISYSLGKMDQFALPQFASGAMENWGLVTYREDRVLYDEKKTIASEKQRIVQIIAHEFAHQWFGNLVSPKWWKYLWLNEGFATFFSCYITDQLDKTYRSVEQSVVNTIQNLFNMDSRNETYPINRAAESPGDIMRKFGFITYRKAMAVIRMLQHYLTDDIFKKGLQRYLSDFQYKAADSDDLFNSIQKVVDEENLNLHVKQVMDAWVNEKGYPIVTVKRNYDNNTMILQQERYVTYNASAEERKDTVWYIPISYATEKNHDFEDTSADILFDKAEESFRVAGAEKNQWIILNKQQTGFYRVNYDEANWKLIINYLTGPDREKIHSLNRAQLIDDALAFFENGILSLQTFMQLINQLKYETDYIPWISANKALSFLKTKLIFSEYYPSFKEYGRNLTEALIKSVGWDTNDNDDHIKKLNRLSLFNLACSFDHADCIRVAQRELEARLRSDIKNTISDELKYPTYCYGLRNANFSLWQEVLNKSSSGEYGRENWSMLEGLGCSSQKEILNRYLYDSLANETCKDMPSIILRILRGTDIGLDVVLDFIIPNIFRLHWKIDRKDRLVDMIDEIGRYIKTKAQLAKLKEMENSNILIPDGLTANAIILAEKNIEWLEKYNKVLRSELKL